MTRGVFEHPTAGAQVDTAKMMRISKLSSDKVEVILACNTV